MGLPFAVARLSALEFNEGGGRRMERPACPALWEGFVMCYNIDTRRCRPRKPARSLVRVSGSESMRQERSRQTASLAFPRAVPQRVDDSRRSEDIPEEPTEEDIRAWRADAVIQHRQWLAGLRERNDH